MTVKVCGMREPDNIREVESLGIDMMGFVFWPHSGRYVSRRPEYLPEKCKRVGVFVDEDLEQVRHIADDFALDYIQLHGHETPEYCAQLKNFHIIKAFNIATSVDLRQAEAYAGHADLFLFDTKGLAAGGNGEKFDWNVLDSYDGYTPFLLSGGIGPEDARRVKAFRHPRCIGIDLNSCFELAPALKDIHRLKTFIKSIRL